MQNTKTFRLFISSTFNDFRREREILQTKVFPRVKEYCSKKGYTFQSIDLRWGINEEAQLDQKTLELCLDEVRSCKSYPYPNFLLMLGDRYGWVPLPYAVGSQEFEEILNHTNAEKKKLLLGWYREDLNQLPASYILKERSGEYADFGKWGEVEDSIRTIFQKTVKQTSLNQAQQRKYFLSATEAEIEEGIIPYINPTAHQEKLLQTDPTLKEVDTHHIFGFFRDVKAESKNSDKFIGDDYSQAQNLKQRVKDELIDENILQAHTMQQDEESLDEQYLTEFEQEIVSFLETKVDEQIAKEQHFTPLEIELQAQAYFAKQKRHNFMGQEELLEIISNYIKSDEEQPLILYGASGRGKSSLMAKSIEQTEVHGQKKVLYRFVGATPHPGSSKEILISLFNELGVDVNSKNTNESFEEFSNRIYNEMMRIKEDVVIFIDAVDHLGHNDQFLWLPNKLPANVKIVISALEDKKYSDDSRYFQTLKAKSDNLHEIPAFNEPTKLLHALLNHENRTVQKSQEEYFLKQYATSASPLYIAVAVQEMKHWKSFDAVVGDELTTEGKVQDLADTQQGIIQEFINNLSDFYHHDKLLVQKVLGYIYASRDGLSESEILQLLSVDEGFVKQIAPDTWHENKSGGLPMVIWARLYVHLKPFLSQKTQDGEELLYFFHREFEDVVKNMYRKYSQKYHLGLANYFYSLQDESKTWDERYYNLRMLSELPYQLNMSEDYIRLKSILFNLEFIGASYDFCKQKHILNTLNKMTPNDVIREDNIVIWKDFLIEKNILISSQFSKKWKLHQSLLGYAYEYEENSIISQQAKKILSEQKVDFFWLKRMNVPKIKYNSGIQTKITIGGELKGLVLMGDEYIFCSKDSIVWCNQEFEVVTTIKDKVNHFIKLDENNLLIFIDNHSDGYLLKHYGQSGILKSTSESMFFEDLITLDSGEKIVVKNNEIQVLKKNKQQESILFTIETDIRGDYNSLGILELSNKTIVLYSFDDYEIILWNKEEETIKKIYDLESSINEAVELQEFHCFITVHQNEEIQFWDYEGNKLQINFKSFYQFYSPWDSIKEIKIQHKTFKIKNGSTGIGSISLYDKDMNLLLDVEDYEYCIVEDKLMTAKSGDVRIWDVDKMTPIGKKVLGLQKEIIQTNKNQILVSYWHSNEIEIYDSEGYIIDVLSFEYENPNFIKLQNNYVLVYGRGDKKIQILNYKWVVEKEFIFDFRVSGVLLLKNKDFIVYGYDGELVFYNYNFEKYENINLGLDVDILNENERILCENQSIYDMKELSDGRLICILDSCLIVLSNTGKVLNWLSSFSRGTDDIIELKSGDILAYSGDDHGGLAIYDNDMNRKNIEIIETDKYNILEKYAYVSGYALSNITETNNEKIIIGDTESSSVWDSKYRYLFTMDEAVRDVFDRDILIIGGYSGSYTQLGLINLSNENKIIFFKELGNSKFSFLNKGSFAIASLQGLFVYELYKGTCNTTFDKLFTSKFDDKEQSIAIKVVF